MTHTPPFPLSSNLVLLCCLFTKIHFQFFNQTRLHRHSQQERFQGGTGPIQAWPHLHPTGWFFPQRERSLQRSLNHSPPLSTTTGFVTWLSTVDFFSAYAIPHFFCKNFILFPESTTNRQREERRITNSFPFAVEVTILPRPLRNLLTLLGSGSGEEARYSAALTSNRPFGTERQD